jgi:hypothetical protein
MHWISNVSTRDLEKSRIALCRPNGPEMANDPKRQAGDPEAQPQPYCASQRAI